MKKGKANLSKVIIFVDVQNKGYKGKKKREKKYLINFYLDKEIDLLMMESVSEYSKFF